MSASPEPERLLLEARMGHGETLGRLLELYRAYLRLLARLQIGRRLQGKLDCSDLVQETFLIAHREFPGFRGTTEGELVCWLRQTTPCGKCGNRTSRVCHPRSDDVARTSSGAESMSR